MGKPVEKSPPLALINPNKAWFADPTPDDDVEFNFAAATAQTRFSQLSGANQAAWFPGTWKAADIQHRHMLLTFVSEGRGEPLDAESRQRLSTSSRRESEN